MLIKSLLIPREELLTVGPEDVLKTALDKINSRNFLSIPVVDGRKFKGVISKERIFARYFEVGGDKED